MQTGKRSPSVNLKIKTKYAGRWTFVPLARDGERYLHGQAIIDGAATKVQGTYYVEWYEDGRRKQKPVGSNWRQAQDAARVQAHVLALRSEGKDVGDAPLIENAGKTLRDVFNEHFGRLSLRHKTMVKYRREMNIFLDFTKAAHAGAVDRNEIIDFMRYLERERNLGPAAVTHNTKIVLGILGRATGKKLGLQPNDWPKLSKAVPKVYQPDPLKKLFEAADREDYELFQCYRMTGFRDKELAFTSWDDLDLKNGTISVTKKPELGFEPKNYQERTIPIPDELVKLLRARRKRYPSTYLIFTTPKQRRNSNLPPGSSRDFHMLDRLKRLAFNAGLNCGRCKGKVEKKWVSCATHPCCKQWGIHRFRHTYATTLLRDRVDLVTVQHLLGHKDLDSTKIYLHAAREEDVRLQISATRLASLEIS